MINTSIRVEQVDNRHPNWSDVLGSIFRTGNQHTLLLHEDGCLSARQTVLAAFDGPQVVGHLCFRVEPARSAIGRTVVQSRLDSFAIEQDCDEQSVEQLLFETAERRAQTMQCPPPRLQLAAC
jgi:hypothetical protein